MSGQAVIGVMLVLIALIVAAAVYDAATCAEWQTVPGEMHCTTWSSGNSRTSGSSLGTIDCQPVRRCVRRTP